MTSERKQQAAWAAAAAALCAVYMLGVQPLGARAWGQLLLLAAAGLVGCALARLCGAFRRGLGVTCSAVLGCAVLAAVTLCASALRLPWLVTAFYAAGGTAAAVYLARQKPWRGLRVQKTHFYLLGTAAVLLALFYCAGAVLIYRHPSAMGGVIPGQDFYWNLGNAESFYLGFPPQDLRYSGVTVTYHYLTELLAAGVSMGALAPSCYDALAFCVPPVLLLSMTASLWEIGGKLFGGKKQSQWLLLIFVLFSGCAGLHKTFAGGASPFLNSTLTHMITNINAVATGNLLLAAFIGLLSLAAQSRFADRTLTGMSLASFALLIFAKGPVAGLAAIGAVCALAVYALRKDAPRLRCLIMAAVIGVSFWLVYWFYFAAGAQSSMSLSLTGTLEKSYFTNFLARFAVENKLLYTVCVPVFMLAQSFLFMPAPALLWLVCALRDVRRLRELELWRLMCHALVLGGMAAFYLFDHPNLSQIYFAFTACLCAAFTAADAWPQWWAKLRGGKTLQRLAAAAVWACVAVGCATAAFTYGGMAARAVQVLSGAPVQDASRAALTPAEEQAMQWLRQNMQPDEVFITNRIHTGKAMEGLSNVYTGLSGRRCYMESFQYAVNNMGVTRQQAAERTAMVEELFNADTEPSHALRLCTQRQINYVVYSRLLPGSNLPMQDSRCFSVCYQNEDVIIYAANITVCC